MLQVKCPLLWAECWIDSDGSVYPCHSHYPLEFGKISEKFETVWNSKNYKILRDAQVLKFPTLICHNCGVNYLKQDENQEVPYDINNFFHNQSNHKNDSIKWSNRSKQFFLKR